MGRLKSPSNWLIYIINIPKLWALKSALLGSFKQVVILAYFHPKHPAQNWTQT